LQPLADVLAKISALALRRWWATDDAKWSLLGRFRKKPMEFGKIAGARHRNGAMIMIAVARRCIGGAGDSVFSWGGLSGTRWLQTEIFLCFWRCSDGGYVASLDPLPKLAEKRKSPARRNLRKWLPGGSGTENENGGMASGVSVVAALLLAVSFWWLRQTDHKIRETGRSLRVPGHEQKTTAETAGKAQASHAKTDNLGNVWVEFWLRVHRKRAVRMRQTGRVVVSGITKGGFLRSRVPAGPRHMRV